MNSGKFAILSVCKRYEKRHLFWKKKKTIGMQQMSYLILPFRILQLVIKKNRFIIDKFVNDVYNLLMRRKQTVNFSGEDSCYDDKSFGYR